MFTVANLNCFTTQIIQSTYIPFFLIMSLVIFIMFYYFLRIMKRLLLLHYVYLDKHTVCTSFSLFSMRGKETKQHHD